MQTKKVGTVLPKALVDRLLRFSAATGIKMQQVFKEALKAYLDAAGAK